MYRCFFALFCYFSMASQCWPMDQEVQKLKEYREKFDRKSSIGLGRKASVDHMYGGKDALVYNMASQFIVMKSFSALKELFESYKEKNSQAFAEDTSKGGQTVLHHIAEAVDKESCNGFEQCIKFILGRHPDLYKKKDENGLKPLDYFEACDRLKDKKLTFQQRETLIILLSGQYSPGSSLCLPTCFSCFKS